MMKIMAESSWAFPVSCEFWIIYLHYTACLRFFTAGR